MLSKNKLYLVICLIIVLALVALTLFAYQGLKIFSFEKIFGSEVIKKQVGEQNEDLLQLAPRLLGFTKPITYLMLFQNNTELRPSGGFIGSYAVIRLDKGNVNIIKVDGTENLDVDTPESWKVAPPEPIKKYLGLGQWYFRDANWSPDFSESAKKALELYKGEGGAEAENIEVVAAITPTVLEKILEKIGPVTVDDEEFTAKNITEKLEYEVEYNYAKKGKDFAERKNILKDLMLVILGEVKSSFIFEIQEYLRIFDSLVEQKQILAFSPDKDLEKIIEAKGWGGEVRQTAGDYLLWVDANLASLKTDHSIKRELHYSIENGGNDSFTAVAEMVYNHTGQFDWRTSRYRTYARVFVPLGSTLLSVDGTMKSGKSNLAGTVDEGVELGKKWFGAFISIEPGQTKSLTFKYLLPGDIGRQIGDGSYNLFVQKQLGTVGTGLTLDLDFGKNISTSTPKGEVRGEEYKYSVDLGKDREFFIQMFEL